MTHANSIYYQMIKVSTNLFEVLPNKITKWFDPNLFKLKFVLKIINNLILFFEEN
jgi:hypothetical protein